MMKFFRKYMKQLLAVFMALLLVVWLGGSALQNILRRQTTNRNEQVGIAFGEPVSLGEMQAVFGEANMLEAMGIQWDLAWFYVLDRWNLGDARMRQQYAFQIRQEKLGSNEWYMLDAAARKAGITVPAEAVQQFKQKSRIDGRVQVAVRDRMNIPLERLDRAIQSFVRVLDAADLACAGIKPSEADIQEFVRQTQEKVLVSAVVLESESFADESYEPIEQEMQELFEQGKDRDPNPESITEPGYRLAEHVQTEYIRISAEELARRYQVSDEEGYEYWTAHKNEFLKPSTQPAATAPAETQPESEESHPYETFTEAKTSVIARMKETKGKQEAVRLARELIARLWRPWAEAPTTQPGNYRVPPESEIAADLYPNLIAAVETRYPGALKYARTGLLSVEQVGQDLDIGLAQAYGGTDSPITFKQAAFLVAGLQANREDSPDAARLFRSLYETCSEPLVDGAGNAYVFRTMAVQPKQAPASWEDVREQLVADIRKLRGYEEAHRQAKMLAEQAAKVGLEAALKEKPDLNAKLGDKALKTPGPFARKRALAWGGQTFMFPSSVPGIGGGEDLIDMCFSLGEEQTTTPEKVKVHEPEDGRRWVVVQWHETLPVTEAEYDAQRPNAIQHLLTEGRMDFLKNWFDSDQIRARIGWEDVKPQRQTEVPEETQETKSGSEPEESEPQADDSSV